MHEYRGLHNIVRRLGIQIVHWAGLTDRVFRPVMIPVPINRDRKH